MVKLSRFEVKLSKKFFLKKKILKKIIFLLSFTTDPCVDPRGLHTMEPMHGMMGWGDSWGVTLRTQQQHTDQWNWVLHNKEKDASTPAFVLFTLVSTSQTMRCPGQNTAIRHPLGKCQWWAFGGAQPFLLLALHPWPWGCDNTQNPSGASLIDPKTPCSNKSALHVP